MTQLPDQEQGPHLVSLAKITVPVSFAADQLNYRTYQAIARHCRRVDYIVQSVEPNGHREQLGNLFVHGLPYAAGWRGHWRFLHGAVRVLRELGRTTLPDLIWTSDPLDSGVVGWYAQRRFHRPLVLQVQGDFFHVSQRRFSPLQRWLMRRLTVGLGKRATRVRAVANRLRTDLIEQGVAPDKVVVIPSRTDMELFDPARYGVQRQTLREEWGWSARRVVVFVGSFNDSKGLDLLLDAAAQQAEACPDLRYVLVGDGPLRTELERQIARLGLTDRVRLPGRVPHDRVPHYLAAADAYVLSSRDEGLPRCLIEAQAMELPAISTRVGGADEIVGDGETGWLVATSAEGLGRGLRVLAGLAEEDRVEMGHRGRARVRDQFDFRPNIESVVRQLIVDITARDDRSR